eukprot:CAMPEP_0171283372 /NCGR_PEP_ID=MMETSP0790-20130122/67403_1 /TAXON_ID=2925 /ORGANISM="Alexandrium catenella, Strain OF101" /LENGTH=236 /DNA_ID=CAMNT_0011752663 /DNA_START=18 /DNA_END=725 /DNA_ORIENTATION=+
MHLPGARGGGILRTSTFLIAALLHGSLCSPDAVDHCQAADLPCSTSLAWAQAAWAPAARSSRPDQGFSGWYLSPVARSKIRKTGLQLVQLRSVTRQVPGHGELEQFVDAGHEDLALAGSRNATAKAELIAPADALDASSKAVAPVTPPATLLSAWIERMHRARVRGFADSAGDIVAIVLLALLVLFLLLLWGKNWNVKEAVHEVQEDPRQAFMDARQSGTELWQETARPEMWTTRR